MKGMILKHSFYDPKLIGNAANHGNVAGYIEELEVLENIWHNWCRT